MAKPLKIVLWIIGGIVAAVLLLVLAVTLVFDPNDYREDIAKSVSKNTGRTFTLGELGLKVFPWIRVSIADATLGNAPGFGDAPFAKIGEASVGVHLLPLLFDDRIEVSTLTLHGLVLNLQKNQDGADNWSDIGAQDQEPDEPQAGDRKKFDPAKLDFGGIDIRDASLSYVDRQSGKQYQVTGLDLTTGSLRAGEDFEVTLEGHVVAAAPKLDADVGIKGTVSPDAKARTLAIRGLELTLKGKAAEQDADLRFTGDLALDRAQGTLALTGAQLKAGALTLDTTIKGENLNGEQPRLSGPIRVAGFNPRELLATLGKPLQTADPEALKHASFSAQYSGSFSAARLEQVVLKLDQTTVEGRLDVRDFGTQAIDFALKVDQLDADRYLPPKAKPAAGGGDTGKPNLDEIELPTETLGKLNANGTVDIGTLKYNGVKMTDVRLKLSGAGAAPRQQEVSARLYGGTFSTSNRISPGSEPTFALKTRLTALDAAPFLRDFIGKDYVSGLGNLTLDLTGAGATLGAAKRTLDGEIGFRFENGVVKGFNLGKILRQAQAALAGNLAYQEDAPAQTDFTAITATARVVDGILKSDSLSGASPGLRLGGAGEINLVDETINYLARVTVVETKTGQGGKALEGLKGLTIPIRLTGSMYDPKRKFELDEVLKDQAEDRLHQEYEKHEDRAKEKLREKLGDFLFGKPKPPAPAPPAQPAPPPPPAETPPS